jgi:hypothetical protein
MDTLPESVLSAMQLTNASMPPLPVMVFNDLSIMVDACITGLRLVRLTCHQNCTQQAQHNDVWRHCRPRTAVAVEVPYLSAPARLDSVDMLSHAKGLRETRTPSELHALR